MSRISTGAANSNPILMRGSARKATAATTNDTADVGATIFEAHMGILSPDGIETAVLMHDDGRHGDLLANDGVFGGQMMPSKPGSYKIEALISGRTEDGRVFQRSTQHVIDVIDDRIEFDGHAVAIPLGEQDHSSARVRSSLLFGVAVEQPTSGSSMSIYTRPYRAYAEVWATDSAGELQPACWIGGIANIEDFDDIRHERLQMAAAGSHQLSYVVQLELDSRWLKLAHLSEPIVLRNAFLIDARTNIPLSRVAEMPLQSHGLIARQLSTHLLSYSRNSSVTYEMRNGIIPQRARLLARKPSKEAADETLLLVHGYCAESNPWEDANDDEEVEEEMGKKWLCS
jgi:hypothetical protein